MEAGGNAISFHEKDPSMPSAADEFVAASKQVRALHKAFPEVDYLIGNHSALPERKAQSVGLPPEVILNFKTLWGLDGWEIHPRFTDLLIDNVIYRHGDKEKGGQMSALKNAQAQFKSLVMGHLHAQAGINYHANQDGTTDCQRPSRQRKLLPPGKFLSSPTVCVDAKRQVKQQCGQASN